MYQRWKRSEVEYSYVLINETTGEYGFQTPKNQRFIFHFMTPSTGGAKRSDSEFENSSQIPLTPPLGVLRPEDPFDPAKSLTLFSMRPLTRLSEILKEIERKKLI